MKRGCHSAANSCCPVSAFHAPRISSRRIDRVTVCRTSSFGVRNGPFRPRAVFSVQLFQPVHETAEPQRIVIKSIRHTSPVGATTDTNRVAIWRVPSNGVSIRFSILIPRRIIHIDVMNSNLENTYVVFAPNVCFRVPRCVVTLGPKFWLLVFLAIAEMARAQGRIYL